MDITLSIESDILEKHIANLTDIIENSHDNTDNLDILHKLKSERWITGGFQGGTWGIFWGLQGESKLANVYCGYHS